MSAESNPYLSGITRTPYTGLRPGAPGSRHQAGCVAGLMLTFTASLPRA